MKPTKTIVFDLDDTLVPEIEYLESAFREIARFVDSGRTNLFEEMMENYRRKENVFGKLIEQYPQLTLDELKRRYRYHVPDFSAYGHIRDLLTRCKESGYLLGLITDGYAVTQRNKIESLGIESLLDLIVISEEFGSEKPSENNYSVFHRFGTDQYYYIGDNTNKDFVTPNKLGWTTICLLDQGRNIHRQQFSLAPEYLPQLTIPAITDLAGILQLAPLF